ncbi:uncharacterized protein AB675_9337 [Cyphellophora attinorum]|uniref:Uncharacterized protein n=1 Tax=Cyphellophora attinorum TaxID=1664694 RepID=A0A0N0NNM2_9EURO|nr:uncharacterized protein AB675_9337 [Phialophora attinorum]KPI41539.1 hypothetical protein AB675_9337 [Phialophora attinorum]
MPTYSQPDRSARKSAGKGFFSRTKDRDDIPPTPSLNGSKRGSSAGYQDIANVGLRPSGSTISTISSVPYSATSDSNTPVSVDYLPREDQVSAIPPPGQASFARGSDFHQYPMINPSQSNGSSHPGGPRPLLTIKISQWRQVRAETGEPGTSNGARAGAGMATLSTTPYPPLNPPMVTGGHLTRPA